MQTNAARNHSRTPIALLAVVLGASALLRLLFLADFPQVQADEGLWTNSTKNFLMFGDWTMDGRTHVFLSPVFHFLSLLTFHLFGSSIESARLVSAAAGTASVYLMYRVARHATQDNWLALTVTLVIAVDIWFVLSSRWALIEPVQLFFALGATALLFGSRRQILFAGGIFALALLTKLNTAVLGLVLAAFLAVRSCSSTGESKWKDRALDSLTFGSSALFIAGVGYLLLYIWSPTDFISAFRFELEGQHFDRDGTAVMRANRWGISPALIGHSVLELIRTTPFLVAFASAGAIIAFAERIPGWKLFGIWLIFGIGFPLIQVFQPVRYFFLAAPALAYFAGVFLAYVGSGLTESRRVRHGTILLYVCFNLSYLSISYLASADNDARHVSAWVKAHIDADAILMTAGYFATDLPNRAYAHYHFAATPEDLSRNLHDLAVEYIVWDESEWPPWSRAFLHDRFEHIDVIRETPLIEVFRVRE